MKLISRITRTALLIVLNAVILLGGGLVAYLILTHPVEVRPPLPEPEKRVHSAVLGVASVDDETILSKPIFRRSRQAIGFYGSDRIQSDEGKADIKSPPPPAPPSPVLVGIVRGMGGQTWVLLESGGGVSRRLLTPGGDFEGWRVNRIGAKDVTLHNLKTSADIKIRLPTVPVDIPTNAKITPSS